jgi:hypothetical protein
MNLMTAAYVDTTTLCLFMLGALFLLRTLRGAGRADAVFATLGFALAAGTKATALVALVPALALVCVKVARMPLLASARIATMAVMGFVVAFSLAGSLRAWLETGSPFYPNDVSTTLDWRYWIL